MLDELGVDPASGRLESTIEGERAGVLMKGIAALPQLQDADLGR